MMITGADIATGILAEVSVTSVCAFASDITRTPKVARTKAKQKSPTGIIHARA